MTINEQFSVHVATLKKPPHTIIADGFTNDLVHMAMGLAGEASEVLSLVNAAVGCDTPFSKKQIITELGDVEFYLEGIRVILTTTRGAEARVLPDYVPSRSHTGLMNDAIWLVITACAVLEMVKKVFAYNAAIDRKKLDDLLYAIDMQLIGLRSFLGLSREEVLTTNIKKLQARYPDGYSNQAAIERRDTDGVDADINPRDCFFCGPDECACGLVRAVPDEGAAP